MTELEKVVASTRRLSPISREAYRRHVREFVDFAGPKRCHWTAKNLERWRDELERQGLLPQSINVYLASVTFASKRLHRLSEGRFRHFAQYAEKLRPEPAREAVALSLAEVRALLGTCRRGRPPDLRDRAIVLVGIHSAFRCAELCGIRLGDIERHVVTVIAKGRRRHSVALPAEPLEALREWLGWLGPRVHLTRSSPVFRSLRHNLEDDWTAGRQALSASGLASILAKRAAAAGVRKRVHPHVLRHTFASLGAEAGMSWYELRKVLGHRSKGVIERYLHHTDPEHASGAKLPALSPGER